MKKILGLVVMMGLLALPAYSSDNSSDNVTIPHTFNSGETISSSQMNENFKILINKINELQSRLDTIENVNTFNYNADHITSGTISLERLPTIPAQNISGLVPNALVQNNPGNGPLITPKKYVIVGDLGTILVSDNLSNWEQIQIPNIINLNDVAYGNNQWVIVGEQGYILNSDNGSDWNSSLHGSDGWKSIIFDNGFFSSIGINNAISSDGKTWTTNYVTQGRTARDTVVGAYCNDQYTLYTLQYQKACKTVDMNNWSCNITNTYNNQRAFDSVYFGEKIYFAYDSGSPVVLNSCGNTEYFNPISELGTFHGLEVCNGEFYAHDHSNTLVKTSDGIDWEIVEHNMTEIGDLYCAENEYFNVINSQLFRSVDMINWEEINLSTTRSLNAIYSRE